MLGSSGERVTAGDLLTLEDLVVFRRISGWRGGLMVLHAWGTIATAAALYVAWPSPLTLAAVVVAIGARQVGLMVLMHEAAHWLLFSGARLNTWGSGHGCAPPRWGPTCESIGAGITCTTAIRSSPKTRTSSSRPTCPSPAGGCCSRCSATCAAGPR